MGTLKGAAPPCSREFRLFVRTVGCRSVFDCPSSRSSLSFALSLPHGKEVGGRQENGSWPWEGKVALNLLKVWGFQLASQQTDHLPLRRNIPNSYRLKLRHLRKFQLGLSTVVHAFSPGTKDTEVGGSLSLRAAWSIE